MCWCSYNHSNWVADKNQRQERALRYDRDGAGGEQQIGDIWSCPDSDADHTLEFELEVWNVWSPRAFQVESGCVRVEPLPGQSSPHSDTITPTIFHHKWTRQRGHALRSHHLSYLGKVCPSRDGNLASVWLTIDTKAGLAVKTNRFRFR